MGVEFRDVTVGYPAHGSHDAVIVREHLNLIFADNKITALLAKSGAGKSTILKTISGLIKPMAGEVLINNGPWLRADKNPVVMMPQGYIAYPYLSVVGNILIADHENISTLQLLFNGWDKHPRYVEALSMLKQVGLEGYENKWPKELSGGMRQRLALGRMMFMHPQILLMDEPMSALDDNTRANMQRLVMETQRQHRMCIVLVTHSPDEARKMATCQYDINIK